MENDIFKTYTQKILEQIQNIKINGTAKVDLHGKSVRAFRSTLPHAEEKIGAKFKTAFVGGVMHVKRIK